MKRKLEKYFCKNSSVDKFQLKFDKSLWKITTIAEAEFVRNMVISIMDRFGFRQVA